MDKTVLNYDGNKLIRPNVDCIKLVLEIVSKNLPRDEKA